MVREKDINNDDDHYSPEHKIKDEFVYDNECCNIHYNKIFDVDYSCEYQLFLIEGDAGTGITTLAYKVCKIWARGDILQQYSCIVLVCLKDIIISQGNISLETLLAAPGQPVNSEICTAVLRMKGEDLLIWFEGWDELHVVQNNTFDCLLKGMMLPLADVVITTRPSGTKNLEKFNHYFTYEFKIIGFIEEQIKDYVTHYCANDCQSFVLLMNSIPGLVHIARVPLYLAILVKLFKAEQLPRKLISVCSDFLMICLQNQKDKLHENTQPIKNINELPPDMQEIFHRMQRCACDRFFHHSSQPFTEEEISQNLFDGAEVPLDFDGLGIFSIKPIQIKTGKLKTYDFIYKLIQELLAALYLSRLEETPNYLKLLERRNLKWFGSSMLD